jgi:hypothetical protein
MRQPNHKGSGNGGGVRHGFHIASSWKNICEG